MYKKKIMICIYSVMIGSAIVMSSLPMNCLAAEVITESEEKEEITKTTEAPETEQWTEVETDDDSALGSMKESEAVTETETQNMEAVTKDPDQNKEKKQKKTEQKKAKNTTQVEERKGDSHNNSEAESETAATEETNAIVIQAPFVLNHIITQTLSEYFSDKVMIKVSALSSLNMREEPNISSKILDKLKAGEIVQLAGKSSEGDSKSALENSCSDDGKWIKIIYEGKKGYIGAEYVFTELEAQNIAVAAEKMTAAIKPKEKNDQESNEEELELESKEFGLKGPLIVTSIVDHQVVVINSEGEEETYEDDLLDYEVAPIEADQLEEYKKKAETFFFGIAMVSGERRNIVNSALQYIGNPYVWGGTSLTEGADCSGFVQSVFGQFGIGLPRVASDQYAASVKVKAAQLQPGDLVFYTDGTEISHVALYIGDGQIVHARNSAMGIRADSINYDSSIVGYGTYIPSFNNEGK